VAEKNSLRRFVVVGPSGSGKTTLGRRIAARLDLPFVELDAIHWGANWTEPIREDFRRQVAQALESEAWVADGNYSKARDITWGRAQALVWLDYSLAVCLARLFVRTVRRVATRERLWNDNHETVRGQLSRDGLIPYTIRTYRGRRDRYATLVREPAYAHLVVFRLRSPREARRWLEARARSGDRPEQEGAGAVG
jgi:adenylate kinase family enzyme